MVKKIIIRDKKWTVKVLSTQVYSDTNGEDSVAVTHKENREIHFKEDVLDIVTIRHELFHAYCAELYLNSADITVTDFEEILAEFLSENLLILERKAKAVRKWLATMKD